MGRTRNFHSKKTRATRKKGGVIPTSRTISSASAIASYKKYRDKLGTSLKKRRKHVNDVSLIASPHATDKQKNASSSRSNTALRLGKMYALLNEASTSRKLLTKQLHALESMEKTPEQKHDKDETELLEIKSNINKIKNQLLAKTTHSVNMDEQDTTIHNMNRYRSTEKLIQSLRNKYQKKSNYANRIK